MRQITMYPHKCSRCGKTFEASGPPVPGMKIYCKICLPIILKIRDMESLLIAQNFSLEQTDAKIAKQIHDILKKERSGISEKDEELLKDLTKKLIEDEKRRAIILNKIKKLQAMG